MELPDNTIRFKVSFLIAMNLLLSCLLWPLAMRSAAEGPQEFPLGQGTYWIYECHIIRKKAQSPAVEKSLTWRVEILETMHHGGVTVAHVKGTRRTCNRTWESVAARII